MEEINIKKVYERFKPQTEKEKYLAVRPNYFMVAKSDKDGLVGYGFNGLSFLAVKKKIELLEKLREYINTAAPLVGLTCEQDRTTGEIQVKDSYHLIWYLVNIVIHTTSSVRYRELVGFVNKLFTVKTKSRLDSENKKLIFVESDRETEINKPLLERVLVFEILKQFSIDSLTIKLDTLKVMYNKAKNLNLKLSDNVTTIKPNQ